MARIELEQLHFAYENHGVSYEALKGIDITIEDGEFVCLVGPSGCGKTTLLRILAGLSRPLEGCVRMGGKAVEGPGVDRAVVFQHYALFPWMTVRENVSFAARQAGRTRSRKEADRIAMEQLERVHMADSAKQYPYQLSGGMCQRVAIARALAMDAEVLLLDEPFGALDARNRAELQALLVDLWSEGNRKTVIFVTHDIGEALLLGDRALYMEGGRITGDISIDVPRSRRSGEQADEEGMERLRRLLLSRFYGEEATG